MDSRKPFPHERLVAWQVAREARLAALHFTRTLPRGYGDERRQINNAAASVVRNLCEGAGRWKPADKIYRFEIAYGEASEAAGAVVSLRDDDLGDGELAAKFLQLEGRAAALITGLIKAQLRRQ